MAAQPGVPQCFIIATGRSYNHAHRWRRIPEYSQKSGTGWMSTSAYMDVGRASQDGGDIYYWESWFYSDPASSCPIPFLPWSGDLVLGLWCLWFPERHDTGGQDIMTLPEHICPEFKRPAVSLLQAHKHRTILSSVPDEIPQPLRTGQGEESHFSKRDAWDQLLLLTGRKLKMNSSWGLSFLFLGILVISPPLTVATIALRSWTDWV